MSASQTDELVMETMRAYTGSTTLNWFSIGGRDVLYINQSELALVEHILAEYSAIIAVNNIT